MLPPFGIGDLGITLRGLPPAPPLGFSLLPAVFPVLPLFPTLPPLGIEDLGITLRGLPPPPPLGFSLPPHALPTLPLFPTLPPLFCPLD